MRRFSISLFLFAVLAFAGYTSAFAAAPVHLAEPYLLNATTSSISIAWITDVEPSAAEVEYGATEALGLTQAATVYALDSLSTGTLYQSIATITDLPANTTYSYKVVSASGVDETESETYTFKTAVPPGTPFNFIETSDLQLKDECPATAREMTKLEADLILFPGDLLNNADIGKEWVGGDEKSDTLAFWRVFQNVELTQHTPLYPAPGNHEWDYQDNVKDTPTYGIEGDDLASYTQMFRPLYPDQEHQPGGKHWYSFDYGDVHFVSLSVTRWWVGDVTVAPGRYIWDPIKEGSPQYEWLEEDLATTDKPFIIVIQHHPAFGSGSNIVPPFGEVTDYAEDYIHRDLLPLYENYGVDMVFYGHDHTLEHYYIRGIHYGQFASFGNTYGIGVNPEPHGETAVYEEDQVRGFLWAQVTPKQITCQVIQGGYKTPGAGTVLHEFVIEAKRRIKGDPPASGGLTTSSHRVGGFRERAFPNPFNASTTIAYQVGEDGPVDLTLYDAAGQKVRTLVNADQRAGSYSIQWDGTNAAGEAVASGTYFYRLTIGAFQDTRSVTLLK